MASELGKLQTNGECLGFYAKGYEEQYNLVMFYCPRQANQRNGYQENATASDSANNWQMSENRYRSSIESNYYQQNANYLQ